MVIGRIFISRVLLVILHAVLMSPIISAMEETHLPQKRSREESPQPSEISAESNHPSKRQRIDYTAFDLSSILESAYQNDAEARSYIFKQIIASVLYHRCPKINMDKLFNFSRTAHFIDNLTHEEILVIFISKLDEKLSPHQLQKLYTNVRAQAEQGFAPAQYNLGWMYQKGMGIELNTSQALFWYQKAAEQDFARAQNSLGAMYQNGIEVEKNLLQALCWYQKAAHQGFVLAQTNLGGMYLKGKGVEKNVQQAFFWISKAAEQGNVLAQYNLGLMYYKGEGVEGDNQQAFFWYQKSAEQGFAGAQDSLGVMYQNGQGVKKNDHQAFFWFKKSAKQGYSTAQNNLARSYKNGLGVKKNDHEAFFWFQKSAEQGHSSAQNNLARLYQKGEGIEQDTQKALFWYQKSAEQGVSVAKNALKSILCLVPQNINIPLEILKKENDIEILNLKRVIEEVLAILLQLQRRNSPPQDSLEFLTACPSLGCHFKTCADYVINLNNILHHLTSPHDLNQYFMVSNITTKYDDQTRKDAFSLDASYLHCQRLNSQIYSTLGGQQNVGLSKIIPTLNQDAEYAHSLQFLKGVYNEKLTLNAVKVLELQDSLYTPSQQKKLYSTSSFEPTFPLTSTEGQLSPEEAEKIQNEIKRLILLLKREKIQSESERLNDLLEKDQFILNCLRRIETIKEKLFEIIENGTPLRNKSFEENSPLFKFLS